MDIQYVLFGLELKMFDTIARSYEVIFLIDGISGSCRYLFFRSGDIDPTVIQFIANKKNMSLDEVEFNLIYKGVTFLFFNL